MLPIAGQTAGPIGLNFFCEHSWVAGGRYRLKNSLIIYIIKTRHSYFYIYICYSWTEWAHLFFVDNHGGVLD